MAARGQSFYTHDAILLSCGTLYIGQNRMNSQPLKALLAFLPACLLLVGSGIKFYRRRTVGVAMQLVGASALALVVLTHICEALHLFPHMHWGWQDSAGHYLDLVSAILGLALFPMGYLLEVLRGRQ